MSISYTEFIEKLKFSDESVNFVGIVPFDIDWEEISGYLLKSLQKNTNFTITIVCESDNNLFSKAFTSDTDMALNRTTFKDLKFIKDEALNLPEYLRDAGAKEDELNRLQIKIMHLPLPIAAALIDGKVFVNTWIHESMQDIKEISAADPWWKSIKSYIETYLALEIGGKFSSNPNDEILELFDHDRIPRGIFPRKSFYDTDYSQLVVWALIFDRKGRLLIHRRSKNAKDNRDMWDKSVGGHVDFSMDVDSSRTIAREVIEELFSDELKIQEMETWSVTDKEMIYLGDWRPEKRKRYPFNEISHFKKEWAFFRLRDSQHLYSPRTIPKGGIRRLRVIADVFLFVAGPNLTENSLGSLMNSEFKLLDLSELKNAMDRAYRQEKVPNFDEQRDIPLFSPDLTNIMTGKLRDILTEFSNSIKRYIKR